QYPTIASLLYSWNSLTYWQACGGTIINTRSILTAAHCPFGDAASRWRVRVGSTNANSGGVVHNLASVINHPSYNSRTMDNDISIMRTATVINYVNNAVQPASIAGANYNLGDNQVVWAAGWGTTSAGGSASEQLRHVQIWTVNQNTCAQRYASGGATITANMLCSGWLDVGGRDQCQGDSGGPLYHNGIVVGVCSWGFGCAQAFYPGVNVLKMRAILILALCLAAVAAVPSNPQRIVGGSVTTINQYPTIASLLYSWNLSAYWQACGGTIINNRSILTAAHCTIGDAANRWRVRVGSTWANSGGVVHNLASIINHPSYNSRTYDNDVAVLRTATNINYVNNAVQPGSIAGANYNLGDNQVVWAAGWGTTSRYASAGSTITANMLCSGWLDVGGRDQCQGDSGGPLYHNGVVVGVCSWGRGCAQAFFPGVNARYPTIASLLYSWNLSAYWQACGGTVINTRSILTAAHCPLWRVRVGSTFANSGGVVHNLASVIIHPSYNSWTMDNDVAILRTATVIGYVNNAVQPASIAGANYNLGDNQVVWAAGWGTTSSGGAASETLRHVQIWTVNQNTCAQRYASGGATITANMLCSGWLDVGGRDQCQGDSGGPLYHNNIVVGVCSWGFGCAQAFYPGVNARVSRYTAWVQANA
ncbi:Trypsin, partial [Operophtera brumata]